MAEGTGLPKWVRALLIVVVVVVGGAFVLGVLAAIALPGLSRARISGNEASAIGMARSVLIAQATATLFNGGFFLPFDCLERPSACLPDYEGEPLISPMRSNGYSARFIEGELASAEERRQSSATAERSLKGFAFLVVPEQPGETGTRSFCVDATGIVCSTTGGAPPETRGGRCSECTPLQ